MNKFLTRLRDEPVLVTTFVQAVLILVVSFGLSLTDAQTIAILGVTGATLALFARSQVTPTKALEELAEALEPAPPVREDPPL